jgi:hypothetical protein
MTVGRAGTRRTRSAVFGRVRSGRNWTFVSGVVCITPGQPPHNPLVVGSIPTRPTRFGWVVWLQTISESAKVVQRLPARMQKIRVLLVEWELAGSGGKASRGMGL